jgi:hypothetical protein
MTEYRQVSVLRLIVGWAATLAACAGMTLASAVVVLFAVLLFVEDGIRICPDGGDEIWSHPSIAAYVPALFAATGLAALLAWRLRVRFRRIGVPFPRAAAGALSASSVGSAAAYIVLSVYLSHTGEPARFRCGESFPGQSVPAWLLPAMVAAFAVAAVPAMAASVAARRRPAT